MSRLGAQVQVTFLNTAADLDKRVDDLIARLTLQEKVSQLMSDSAPVERFAIPRYNWWNESLHGVGRAGRATVFPQAIGLAASWDLELMARVSNAISDEARAKHHEFVRRGKTDIYQGLTFWTPNINIFRDPRWGKGMETYGEDPYLTSRLAVQFIKGLQGTNPKYLKLVATPRHFAAHSGPDEDRHAFDAKVSAKDLVETYLPQFEAAVKEGGAYSVMCANNRLSGDPVCANPKLLEQTLRKQWGFQGYVVSDCAAITDIYQNHKTAATPEEAAAKAIKSGTDLNCGVEYSALLQALKQGLIAEADINTALRRVLTARFRLGMFDAKKLVPYAQIPYSVVDSELHKSLAVEAARKSIVLLKNEGGLLPLRKDLKTIAVIGPNAHNVPVLLSNSSGDPSKAVTVLDGIRMKVIGPTRTIYAPGAPVAAGLPSFEVIPPNAFFTSKEDDKKNGLVGEYFGTSNFNGKAYRFRELTYPNTGQTVGEIIPEPKPLFTRIDSQIDFRWADGAPRKDMNDDSFGVRWTGYLSPPVSGLYQIGAMGQNAFEIYLEDKQLVKFNSIHERSFEYETVELKAGKLYAIKVDFHHTLNDADIKLVWSLPESNYEHVAMETAKLADTIIVALGLSPRLEGEEMKVPIEGFAGGDRVNLGLPRIQEELVDKLLTLGKPVVVVLLNGGALGIGTLRDKVPAILEAWYPGQAAGTALADVIFGDYNPAGRLPVTFYQSAEQLPPFSDYSMKGRTYRYFEGKPLYPFGYGLSYTAFAYRGLTLPPSIETGSELKVTAEVENTGGREGEEVVQLYVSHPKSNISGPIRSLQGFQRILLKPHEKRTVEFSLSPRQLSEVTEEGERIVQPGIVEVSVGGKQPGFTGPADAATTQVLTGQVKLAGKTITPE